MLSNEIVQAARRLIASGEAPYREIAFELGISRDSVSRIAKEMNHSRRGGVRRVAQTPGARRKSSQRAIRCPDCGGLIYPPCIYCRTLRREATELRPQCQPAGPTAEPSPEEIAEQCLAFRAENPRDPVTSLQPPVVETPVISLDAVQAAIQQS